MPCHSATITNPLTVKPDTLIEDVLAKMAKKKTDYAVIVDKDKIVQGLFSAQILMKNLLPVSVAMADGVSVNLGVRAAPGIAKRLKKVLPLPVSDIMERKLHFVRPETAIWEGINALVQYGDPLVVVEDENLRFMGLMVASAALEDLQKLDDE